MNTNSVNALNFESSSFQSVNDEAKGSASVSAREDVFVHEKTPDEILILPRLAQTSDLQEEDTIVVQHVIDLRKEGSEVTDTDVLGHLETGDLLVAAINPRSVTVVKAQDTALRILNTSIAKTLVTPSSLVTTQGDTGDLSTIVNRSILSQSTPATTEIKDSVTGLNTDLFANNSQLVVLKFLESLFLVGVADDTGSVDHAGAQEPSVEVITAVVVVTNLLLIYRSSSKSARDLAHRAKCN